MSVLAALDATTICARRPVAPEAWALPVPNYVRPAVDRTTDFSWLSLARNPQALLLTGVITAGLVRDTLAQVIAGR